MKNQHTGHIKLLSDFRKTSGAMPLLALIRAFFILALLAGHFGSTYGQNYPVQSQLLITPPYSPRLSDYTAGESDKMMLTLLLKEVSRPDYQVKLHVKIEGEGMTISTKATFRPVRPIILQGGMPEILNGADIAEYFQPQNLDFHGISRQEYERTGKLKEGIYRICVTVLDYNRRVPVSNAGCMTAWMVLNDPPIVNMPYANEKLRVNEPQNIMFNWSPRHTGSPNAAFSTEYVFQLVEIWPANRNPNDAINTTAPIYEAVTSSTSLLYGPAEPPLVPGRKYAFRVRARDVMGRDLFKNNGLSEVSMFQYGDECMLPTDIVLQVQGPGHLRASWEPHESNTEFVVQYKEKNSPNAQWFESRGYLNNMTINGLKPSTEYRLRLRGRCGHIETDFSTEMYALTDALMENDLDCGAPPAGVDLSNTVLLASLNAGDVFKAGEFEVQVTSVSGSNGRFTGTGIAVIPLMNRVKVNGEFSDITINDTYVMLDGKVKLKGAVVQLVDDETKASIQEKLDQIGKGFEKVMDYVEALESLEGQVQLVLKTLGSDIPQEYVNVITAGVNEIVEIKALLADEDNPDLTDAVKTQLGNKIKEVENKVMEGLSNAQAYVKEIKKIIDDLQKLVEEVLREFKKEGEDDEQQHEAIAKENLDKVDALNDEMEEKLKDLVLPGGKGGGEVGHTFIIEGSRKTLTEEDIERLKSYGGRAMGIYFESMDLYNRARKDILEVKEKLMMVNNFLQPANLKSLAGELKNIVGDVAKEAWEQIKAGEGNDQVKEMIKTELRTRIENSVKEKLGR